MKLQYLLFVLLLITMPAFSQTQKVKDIERIAQEWAAANNEHNTEELERLYAPTVLFYGKSKDVSSCIKDKEAFFKANDYTISISKIDIDFYKNGTVKCNFSKNESWKGVDREDQAYLLLEKNGNNYLITGESDNRMDSKLGVDLRLGDKEYKKSSLFNILIGAAGGAILILGIIFYFRKSKKGTPKKENTFAVPAPVPESKVPVEKELTSWEKGVKFEKYIANLFDAKSKLFEIKYWSSDKIADNGLSPTANRNPDIEFLFNNDKRHSFAIECKWRQGFIFQGNNSGIEWAKLYQIKWYEEYERKENIPVWVAIGIGGTPDNPQQLFLTKLSNIAQYPFVFESFLKNYRRNPVYRLYYNAEQKLLL
jgi:hypothetical protein